MINKEKSIPESLKAFMFLKMIDEQPDFKVELQSFTLGYNMAKDKAIQEEIKNFIKLLKKDGK